MQEVFAQLEKITEYTFLYKPDLLKKCGRMDIDVKDVEFNHLLKDLLYPFGLSFTIDDRVIIITPAEPKKEKKQRILIKGRVLAKDSTAIPGVTILLKGTSTGLTTDNQGFFTFILPDSTASREFTLSFIGMKTQTLRYKDRPKTGLWTIILEEEVLNMDEVVVTGYQQMRKSDVVGSITTVKTSDIMMPGYTSIDQMLQGRVAGMVVTNTSSRIGTSPKIRIRGTSTILGNQDPLWVVDGIIQPDPLPIDRSDVMIDDLKNILGNQISWLNPADIETITILKDAAATAIYGSKAANGVIVITTKRGKEGRMTVNYGVTFSFRARPHYNQFNLMNSKERIQFSREAFEQGVFYSEIPVGSINTYEGIIQMLKDKQLTGEEAEKAVLRLESANTDWFKILTRNSLSHNHHLSISGGTNKVTYNASLGFNDQAGIELQNNAQNLSARLSLGVQLHPKVRMDIVLGGAINKNRSYAAGVNPLGYAKTTSRAIPAYEESGDLYYIQKAAYYKLNARDRLYLKYNILHEMEHSYSQNKAQQMNGSFNFSWEIFPWLKYEFVGGINTNTGLGESFAGTQTFYVARNYRGYDYGTEEYGSEKYNAAMLPYGGELFNSERNVTGWNIQNKIVIQKAWNEDHRLGVLLGTESSSTSTKNASHKTFGYMPERGERVTEPTPLDQLKPIGAPVDKWGILQAIYNGSGWMRTTQTANLFSLFATLTYSLKHRYVLNASIRNDVSNRFGQDQNKRFDPTFSFGVSWNIAQEPLLNSISAYLNQFTLRAAYGIQGNAVNSISPDLILTMGPLKEYYGSFTSSISRLPNPDLSWERTKTWNLGVDIQLFRWITMNLEYYTKRSNNIIKQTVAYEYGINDMDINGGRITNSGIEYTLNITPIRTKNWGWTIGLNSSKNWNKAQTEALIHNFTAKDYLEGKSDRILKKGYPLSGFWSFSYKGLNHDTGLPEFNHIYQQDEEGKIKLNPHGQPLLAKISEITDFLVYSGKTEPDFTGGITTRLRWKNLTFGANCSLLIGAQKRLPSPFPGKNHIPTSDINLDRELINRWKEPGDERKTNIPGLYTGIEPIDFTLPDVGFGGNTYTGTMTDPYEMWEKSDLRVVNASFFRCQQMSLTWNMSERICMQLGIKSFSVQAIVNNVFVIASKKFHGFDPELGNSVQPKTYSVGINVGF